MISIHFQGKPFNITVMQVYAPNNNAEEAEDEEFYEDLQDLLKLTPKRDVLCIIGDWMQKLEVKKYLELQTNMSLEYRMKQAKGKQSFAKRTHWS